MIPRGIYQMAYVKCNICGKTIEISIPYKYVNSTLKEDLYVKDRLEQETLTCDCEGIKEKCLLEYNKMNPSYSILHNY